MVRSIESQEHVYLADTYRTEIATRVAGAGRDDGPWTALCDNLFHPQGGGQPADRGWVEGYEVVPARRADGVVAVRAAAGDGLGGLAAGDTVNARIDADLRMLHAALHTAGHLIESAGRGLGWVLAGNVHFPRQARIEFTAPSGAPADPAEREEVAERLREGVAKAIADDLPVTADHDADGLRIVHIGDLHAAPCGGTHVRSLIDLADVTISGVKVKKGRVRVSYSATHRPR